MKNLSMPRSSLLMWLFLLIAQFGFSGCETIETKVPPAIQTQVGGEDSLETLRVGDRIRIIYLDIPTPPPAVEQVIPEDGKLTLHMGVAYNFAGKKRNQVEREIEDIYVNDRRIYKKVTVVIEKQATFISVGGEVRSPSSIVHRGDLTVLSAIDAAGGFTEFAKRTRVIITRGSNKQQITVNAKKAIVNPSLNLMLYPGDTVYVPRSGL
jgi:polysaccharide export outer membrane protein